MNKKDERKTRDAFGANFKRLREVKYKRNAGKLAKLLDVTTQTISNYEKGVHFPRIEFLLKLPALLDCSMNELLQPLLDSNGTDADFIDICNRIRKLIMVNKKKDVLRLIKFIELDSEEHEQDNPIFKVAEPSTEYIQKKKKPESPVEKKPGKTTLNMESIEIEGEVAASAPIKNKNTDQTNNK